MAASGTLASGVTAYSSTIYSSSAADTVAFTDRYRYLTVTNAGANPMYFRADGTAAVAGANDCYVVLPNETRVVANALPTWYQSSNVLVYGDDNANAQSKAGGLKSPGAQVSIAGTANDGYTVAAAG